MMNLIYLLGVLFMALAITAICWGVDQMVRYPQQEENDDLF